IPTLRADDASQLQLIVECLAAVGRGNRVVMTNYSGGVGEVKNRDLIPFGHHVQTAVLAAGFHMLLESVKVANTGDGWQWKSHLFSFVCFVSAERRNICDVSY